MNFLSNLNVEFDFESHVASVAVQINAPGAQGNKDAREAALSQARLSAPAGMTSQKLEEKFRTVVCRHWLRGLCMKVRN